MLARVCHFGGLILKELKLVFKPSEPQGSLDPFTPVTLDSAQFERYEREMLRALRNKQVKNIAITGGYGAGKSSLIHTFISRHCEYKYAMISLATFRKEQQVRKAVIDEPCGGAGKNATGSEIGAGAKCESDDVGDTKHEQKPETVPQLLTRIEETIVQQLLYAVPASSLPRTRLRRIVQESPLRAFVLALSLFFIAISGLRLYLLSPDSKLAIDTTSKLSSFLLFPDWLAALLLGLGFFYFLYRFALLAGTIRIDGLAIKGGKVETLHATSVLHRNVDEIIYCFERSGIEVVIIEDLDRFGIQDIFFRLREISFIVNQSPSLKDRVKFLYALNDELFEASEKAKFFDVCIPVVPVINRENSHVKMRELLGGHSVRSKDLLVGLDPNVVETISYYVDDMRLVKSIVNEFDIFTDLLAADIGLDANKLFSMVALKNLHPREYWGLMKHQGITYGVFEDFPAWGVRRRAALESRISELRHKKEAQNAELVKGKADLRKLVWMQLAEMCGNAQVTHLEWRRQHIGWQEFIADDVFESLQAPDRLDMYQANRVHSSQAPQQVLFSDALDRVDYQRKLAALEGYSESAELELATKSYELLRASYVSFPLAAREGLLDDHRKELSALPLVRHLLTNGLLDTDFSDYFGYFYEHSMSREDMEHVLSVRRFEDIDVHAKVRDPGRFVAKLSAQEIDRGAGILSDVMSHLATRWSAGDGAERDRLQLILDSCLSKEERFAQALSGVLRSGQQHHLIRAIFELRPQLLRLALDDGSVFVDPVERQRLVRGIIDCLDVGELSELEKIEETKISLALQDISAVDQLLSSIELEERGWAFFKLANLRFRNLSEDTEFETLARLIAIDRLEPSLRMLTLVRDKALADQDAGRNEALSFRVLLELHIEHMRKYIEVHAEDIAGALVTSGDLIPESTESFDEVMSLLLTSPAMMQRFFEATDCPVSSLKPLPAELWASALEEDRVIDVRSAALNYFEKYVDFTGPSALYSDVEASEEDRIRESKEAVIFLSFVQRNANAIGKSFWKNDVPMERAMLKYLLWDDNAPDELIDSISSSTTLNVDDLRSTALSQDRWAKLVRSSYLPFEASVYALLKEQALPQEAAYLARRWKQARGEVDLTQISGGAIIQLSEFLEEDLESAVLLWSSKSTAEVTQIEHSAEAVAKLCRRLNREGISFPSSFAPVLLELSRDPKLDSDYYIDILIQLIPHISWHEFIELSKRVDDPGFAALDSLATRLVVALNPGSKALLDALHVRGYLGKPAEVKGKLSAGIKRGSVT